VSGTPTVVIGELLIPGGMSLANLKELVSKGQKTQDNLASSKDD
jgi:protein-disulfide isomerase